MVTDGNDFAVTVIVSEHEDVTYYVNYGLFSSMTVMSAALRHCGAIKSESVRFRRHGSCNNGPNTYLYKTVSNQG